LRGNGVGADPVFPLAWWESAGIGTVLMRRRRFICALGRISRLICAVCVIARIFVFANSPLCPDKHLFVRITLHFDTWKLLFDSSDEAVLLLILE
jgi:hypothetical protein